MVLAVVPYTAVRVRAQSGVTIAVVFSNGHNTMTVKNGSDFTVSINVYSNSTSDINFFDMGIQWNPATVALKDNNPSTDVVEGGFLKAFGGTVWAGPSPSGTNLAAGYMSDIPDGYVSGGPAHGNGTMFTISFKCISPGSSNIGIMSPNVVSYLLNNASTPALIPFSAVNGTVIQPYPISITTIFPETGMNTLNTVAGSAFNVSININDTLSAGGSPIDFYQLGIQWNPAVVTPYYSNVTKDVVEGPFMRNFGATVFPGPPVADDETNVTLGWFADIPCGFTGANVKANGTGTLFTVLFQCIAPGESNIGIISPNTVSYLLLNLTQVKFSGYNATVTQTTPPPAPTAIITSPTNGQSFKLGANVTLDGSHSLPGWNSINDTFAPITIWNWTVTMPNGTVHRTGSVALVVASIAGTWTIKLTVIAPGAAPNSSSETIEISVIPKISGPFIDVYTARGGKETSEEVNGTYPAGYKPGLSDSYAPQELVCVYANVTFTGAPVWYKPVEFIVELPNGTEIASYESFTNASGIAKVCFRIPWEGPTGKDYFGTMSINGTTEVANDTTQPVQVSNTVQFYYGWLLEINNITINGMPVYPTEVSTPTVHRDNAANTLVTQLYPDVMNVTVTVCSNMVYATLPVFIECTACDVCNVPIGQFTATMTVEPATSNNTLTATGKQLVHYCGYMVIPEWAYIGTGTLYVDLLTAKGTIWASEYYPYAQILNPGTPYCPQENATFNIAYP